MGSKEKYLSQVLALAWIPAVLGRENAFSQNLMGPKVAPSLALGANIPKCQDSPGICIMPSAQAVLPHRGHGWTSKARKRASRGRHTLKFLGISSEIMTL